MKLKKISLALVGMVAAAVAPVAAFAQTAPAAPTSILQLSQGVSFTDVGTAILAISASLIAFYLIWKGAKLVVHAVKGG
jgi:hypothetical protein